MCGWIDRSIGQVFQVCLLDDCLVATKSGDEFVVLLSNLDPEESHKFAEQIAQKILVKLSEPHHLSLNEVGASNQTMEYQCTASIGVTLSKGHDRDRDALLRQADKAMYQAKELGRNTVCFYSE